MVCRKSQKRQKGRFLMTHSIFDHAPAQKRCIPLFFAIFAICAVILAGCIRPAPPTPTVTPSPIVTDTPAPYPAPIDYGVIDHNVYPPPEPLTAPILPNTPSCLNSIEYPSEVWTDGVDIYSRTCVNSAMAGAGVTLYDQDTDIATWVPGRLINPVRGCIAYQYEPWFNGKWIVQVMILDPGGISLCYISPTPISRWWYIFIQQWKP